MKSLWNEGDASKFSEDLLALRVYSSRLLGQEPSLVLHGGGNTSVKITAKDPLSSNDIDVLYVKGSGWDLATIEKEGFAPVKLEALLQLASRESLSDSDMVDFQRISMIDAKAPNPSIEAIVHALIPYKFVDHTHSDSVVTITNNPSALKILEEVYGSKIAVLPYVMPGFVLAKAMQDLMAKIQIKKVEGIVLLNHGIFTFGDSAKESYERMIKLVSLAENYLVKNSKPLAQVESEKNLLELAEIRLEISQIRKKPCYCLWNREGPMVGFSKEKNAKNWISRGTLTPDHVIRTKKSPMFMDTNIKDCAKNYAKEYEDYFNRNKTNGLQCLDLAPRYAVWPGKGLLSFGTSPKEAKIVMDIAEQTVQSIWKGEQIGGWLPLNEKQLFEIEYWELEQAKLKKASTNSAHNGKIALVTGAASGIGKAIAKKLWADGCAVVGLDINPEVKNIFNSDRELGFVCDLNESVSIKEAIDFTVEQFGGLDILINNAGIFTAGQYIENIEDNSWDKSLKLNLTAAEKLMQASIPYLKLGIEPSIIIVASRNVHAPGPGAAAYSVAKAGLTQLGRVAALELAPHGIRVNIIHPDAVFDTELWTPDVLKRSAQRYGLTVDEYKRKNLMKTEITSNDVGELVSVLAGKSFLKTTGAQIPIDGGNDRII